MLRLTASLASALALPVTLLLAGRHGDRCEHPSVEGCARGGSSRAPGHKPR